MKGLEREQRTSKGRRLQDTGWERKLKDIVLSDLDPPATVRVRPFSDGGVV